MRLGGHDGALVVESGRVYALQQNQGPGHDATVPPDAAQGDYHCAVPRLAQLCMHRHPAAGANPSFEASIFT